MRLVYLVRNESTAQGTFGRIYFGDRSLFTGELQWNNNKSSISCIPTGSYKGMFTYSPRFKRKMYLVRKAEGRSGIRIHPANLVGNNPPYKKQLEGCIALGRKIGWLKGQKAILVSRPAVREFEQYMDGQTFNLEICNGYS